MKARVAEIVAAYVRRNQIGGAELPALIASVSQSLASLGQPHTILLGPLTPAVPIRRSVNAEAIICLDCGAKAKMLKRHLLNAAPDGACQLIIRSCRKTTRRGDRNLLRRQALVDGVGVAPILCHGLPMAAMLKTARLPDYKSSR